MFSSEKFVYCKAIVLFVCICISSAQVSSAHQIEFTNNGKFISPFTSSSIFAGSFYRTRKKSQQLHFDWRKIGQNLFVVVFEIINDSMFRLPFLSFSPSHHRHRHNPMKINDVNAYAQVRIRYWMAHKNRPIDCYSSKMFHPPNGKQFVVFIVFIWASLCEKNTTNKPYHIPLGL